MINKTWNVVFVLTYRSDFLVFEKVLRPVYAVV